MYRTAKQLRQISERHYDAVSRKAVADFIRRSRTLRDIHGETLHARLVRAYEARDEGKLASLLLNSRAVEESFEGGGGYNLVRANALAYVKHHMSTIGRMLAKAPARPRSNPSRERLYHIDIVRVHPRTGERIDDRSERITSLPVTHKQAMTIVSKWSPYRGRQFHTSWRLVPVR